MCFSAPASFAASGVLGGISAASFRISRGRWRLVAVVPLLFAAQQALEGVQWLALERGAPSIPAAYGYLFFALMLWPVFIPFAVGRLEPASRSRTRWFLVPGITVAALSGFWLAVNGVDVSAATGHINYGTHVPGMIPAAIVYVTAVTGPLFSARTAAFRWFGVFLLAEAVLAYVLWEVTFASVWCFFAAVTSMLAYGYLRRR